MTDKKDQEPLDGRILDRLYETVESRRGADPGKSYTAKLLARGPAHLAKKLGEEGVETAIEGVRGDRERLAEESADLLYHLMVLLAACDARPEDVWRALERRAGVSGIDEKKSRQSKA